MRAVLTGHPGVEIPGETGFLPRMLQLRLLWWGRRGVRPRVFTRLICGNGRLARSGLSADEVRQAVVAASPTSPVGAIGSVYVEIGRRAGKSIVGDKTPFYIDHLDRLGKAYPDARFIQLVRHPLDTVSSLMVQPWGPDDPVVGAWEWNESQRAAKVAGLGDRLLTMRLEDLVARPAEAVGAMCEHLGIDEHPAMLEFAGRADRIADQNVHPDSHQGIGNDLVRTRDWSEHLTDTQAAQSWALVADTASDLGYAGPEVPPVHPPRWRARLGEIAFRIGRQRKRLVTIRRVMSR